MQASVVTFILILMILFMNVVMETAFIEVIDVMGWMIVVMVVMKELRTVVR